MFDLDDCMAFVTSQSAKVFAAEMERRLRPYHVTRTQWLAMYYIYTNKTLNQRELAERMSLKDPTVVRMLQKMEMQGYLLRTEIIQDKRQKQLSLSEKGQKVCMDLLPVIEKFKEDTIAGISKEDLQTMKDVLAKMVANAKSY